RDVGGVLRSALVDGAVLCGALLQTCNRDAIRIKPLRHLSAFALEDCQIDTGHADLACVAFAFAVDQPALLRRWKHFGHVYGAGRLLLPRLSHELGKQFDVDWALKVDVNWLLFPRSPHEHIARKAALRHQTSCFQKTRRRGLPEREGHIVQAETP